MCEIDAVRVPVSSRWRLNRQVETASSTSCGRSSRWRAGIGPVRQAPPGTWMAARCNVWRFGLGFQQRIQPPPHNCDAGRAASGMVKSREEYKNSPEGDELEATLRKTIITRRRPVARRTSAADPARGRTFTSMLFRFGAKPA